MRVEQARESRIADFPDPLGMKRKTKRVGLMSTVFEGDESGEKIKLETNM